MANSILTPTMVTREALRVLHQKATFLNRINRQYDNRFAVEGAKIGSTLQIRLPNQYTVRTGPVISTQDTAEASVALTVATQKGVDVNFTSADLTLSLQDFSKRIIDPAISVLAANIESDVFNGLYKTVPNMIDHDGTALAFIDILNAKRKLDENLAPEDQGARSLFLTPAHNATFVNANTAIFNPAAVIGKQWREGMTGPVAGVGDAYVTTHANKFTTGTAQKTTGYSVDSTGTVSGSTITVKSGSTTFLKGDVITIATLNAVHPETKANLGYLKQFVVTADSGASATSLSIYPAIVTSGAKQNVSAAITSDQVIVKIGAGASETLDQSMLFHKDFGSVAFADLVMPKGIDFAAREVFDGISMRIVRAYDITNDKFPCRIDVLYGYAGIRPELACRIHADG